MKKHEKSIKLAVFLLLLFFGKVTAKLYIQPMFTPEGFKAPTVPDAISIGVSVVLIILVAVVVNNKNLYTTNK